MFAKKKQIEKKEFHVSLLNLTVEKNINWVVTWCNKLSFSNWHEFEGYIQEYLLITASKQDSILK